MSLLGPLATPQQILNGQVAGCLFHCCTKLDDLMKEHSEVVSVALWPSISVCDVQLCGSTGFGHAMPHRKYARDTATSSIHC